MRRRMRVFLEIVPFVRPHLACEDRLAALHDRRIDIAPKLIAA